MRKTLKSLVTDPLPPSDSPPTTTSISMYGIETTCDCLVDRCWLEGWLDGDI